MIQSVYKEMNLMAGTIFLFLTSIYLMNVVIFCLHNQTSIFIQPEINSLCISSIALFLFILIFVFFQKQTYFLLLPFILIGLPNIINDIFPSFFIGPEFEKNRSEFSLITHIDIYLLFGIFLHFNKHVIKINRKQILNVSFIVLLLLLFYLATIIRTANFDQLALFSTGTYQIRYLLLFLGLGVFHKISSAELQKIIIGFCLVIPFMLMESLIFTYISNKTVLASGNLASNVFANTIAALVLFLLFLPTHSYKLSYRFKLLLPSTRFLLIVMGIAMILANGTRIALISLVGGGMLLAAIFYLNIFKLWNNFRRLIFSITIFSSIIIYGSYSERLSKIGDVIFALFTNNLQFSEHTTSLFARLYLFVISLNMINENWFFGVGPGRWNFLKYKYGFEEVGSFLNSALLDPHNDYLSYLSQYGIFGIMLIIILLINPAWKFIRNHLDPYFYFGIIPFAFLISGITNSNTLKHQIAGLVSMVFLIICQRKSDIGLNIRAADSI